MLSLRRVLLFTTLVAGWALAQELPPLPDQFSSNIEVTDQNARVTARRNEYYDYPNNRFRMDIYTEDQEFVEIFDFNENVRYELLNWHECSAHPFNDTTFPFLEDPSQHHLRKLSELWYFDQEATYLGMRTARDIECQAWGSQMNQEFPGGSVQYNFTWYFSAEDWEIHEGSSEHRVPIKTEIEGSVLLNNGSAIDVLVSYEIVFFEVGEPRHWVFDVPRVFGCSEAVQKDLPELADQFETSIEFTNVLHNYTGLIYEFYDYPGQHYRLDHSVDGSFAIDIWSFTDQHRVEIRNGVCTLSEFDSSSIPFADHGKLPTASSFLHFGRQYDETYIGRRTARGIPCDVWRAEFTHETDDHTTNYTLHYYFSEEQWEMHTIGGGNSHRVPVRGEMYGRRYFNNGTEERIHFLADYINYRPGLPPFDVFKAPERFVCRNEYEVALPELPNSFSTGIEFTIVEKQYTAVMREYYDGPGNRFRVDFSMSNYRVISITLPDENKRIIYENGVCRVESDTGSPVENPHTGHLRNVSSFFHFGAEFDEHYQGERHLRGIPVDHWATKVNHTEDRDGQSVILSYDLHYYFAVPEWQMIAHLASTHRSPVRAEIRGHETWPNGTVTNLHHVYDFVDFNVGELHDYLFTPPHYWNCPGYEPPPTTPPTTNGCENVVEDDGGEDDEDGGSGVSAGGGAALFFFGLALGLGGGIGALVGFQALRRKKNHTGPSGNRDTEGRVELEEQ